MNYENLCYGCFSQLENGRCPRCGFDPTLEPQPLYALPLGTILNGRYMTGKALGMGGFGVTYLGFDMVLEMRVAIKEYLPSGMAVRAQDGYAMTLVSQREAEAYRAGSEKFLDEARVLAKLKDVPNIVGVLDYFNENNTAYFVMDYVEGESLKRMAQNAGGRLPYERVRGLLLPVMEALCAVHAQSLLHRDISPDNIIVTPAGKPVLLDFGAARSTADAKSLSVILKHGFAPEEQYRSHGAQGPWTDVYAMAATLYNLITGAVPENAVDRLQEDHLASPAQLGVALPQTANQAIMQGLAIRPENRFRDMRALINALSIPICGGPNSIPPQFRKTGPEGTEKRTVAGTAAATPAAQAAPKGMSAFFQRLKTDKKLLAVVSGGGVLLLALAIILPLALGGNKHKDAYAYSGSNGGSILTPAPIMSAPVVTEAPQTPELQPTQSPQPEPFEPAMAYENQAMGFSMGVPEGFALHTEEGGVDFRMGEEDAQILVLQTYMSGLEPCLIYDRDDFAAFMGESSDYIYTYINGLDNYTVSGQQEGTLNGEPAWIYVASFDDTSSGHPCSSVLIAVDTQDGLGCYLIFLNIDRTLEEEKYDKVLSDLFSAADTFTITGKGEFVVPASDYTRYHSDVLRAEVAYRTQACEELLDENESLAFYPDKDKKGQAQVLLFPTEHGEGDMTQTQALDLMQEVLAEDLEGVSAEDDYESYYGRYNTLGRKLQGKKDGEKVTLWMHVIDVNGTYWMQAALADEEHKTLTGNLYSSILWSFRYLG